MALLARVQGSGFRVQGSGVRGQGSGVRIQGSGLRVEGSGARGQSSGVRVMALLAGARAQGRHQSYDLWVFFFFFFTLVTGPRRSLRLKLSDTRVYEP